MPPFLCKTSVSVCVSTKFGVKVEFGKLSMRKFKNLVFWFKKSGGELCWEILCPSKHCRVKIPLLKELQMFSYDHLPYSHFYDAEDVRLLSSV